MLFLIVNNVSGLSQLFGLDSISIYLIGATLLVLIVILAVTNFDVFIYLYIFLLPLESVLLIESQGTALFSIMKPLGLFIFLGWFVKSVYAKSDLTNIGEVFLPALFAVLGLCSALWSYSSPESAVRIGIHLLMDVFLFFLLYQWFNPQRIWRSTIVYTGGVLISSVSTVSEFIRNPVQRMAFQGQNEGIYPVTLVVGLFFLLYIVLNGDKAYQKILSLLLFIIVYFAALISGTRSFIYTSLVIFPIFIYKNMAIKVLSSQNRERTIMYLIASISSLAAFSIMFNMFIKNYEVLHHRFQMGFAGNAVGGRLSAIKNTYLVFQHNFLLGVGLGNYPSFSGSKTGIFLESHNMFVTSLQELGIIGFIVFSTFYLRVLGKAVKMYGMVDNSNKYMLLTVYSFFMISLLSLTEPLLQQKYLWFILAQVVAMHATLENTKLFNLEDRKL